MSTFTDAERDAQDLAELVNGTGFVTTRYGDNPKRTWHQLQDEFDATQAGEYVAQSVAAADRAETAADAAALSGNIYDDTAAGIAATVSGDYFSIVSTDGENYLDLYKNESGVAVFKKTYPSVSGIIKPIKLENIAKNQNFINQNDLSTVNAVIDSVINNTVSFTTNASFGQVYQTLQLIDGHIYYLSQKFKSSTSDAYLDVFNTNTAEQLVKVNHSGSNKFENLNAIFTSNTDDVVRFRLVDPRSGYVNSLKEFIILDLTASFGQGEEPSLREINEIINVCTNGSSFFTNDNINVFGDIYSKNTGGNAMFVNIEGTNLTTIQKYSSTQDLVLEWDLLYPNYIFNLKQIRIINNTDDEVSTDYRDGTVIYNFGTDTLGPWRVKALSNIDGDDPSSLHFTGGVHGYLNDYFTNPLNTPTATNSSLAFKVDGITKTSFTGLATTVGVFFSNDVQATNTKKADGSGRNVLTENYELEMTSNHIGVSCKAEFLEPVNVSRYYGLQTVIPAFYKDKIFYESSDNLKYNSAGVLTTSINDTCNHIVISKNGNFIDVELDTNTGMGRSGFRATSLHNAFSNTSDKSYFYLIEDTNFDAGDVVSYKGSYSIYSNS